AHLHQSMPMPQQLSQVAVLRIRHPDPRETVFDHQPQQQLRILPIGLLLAHPFGADLGGVPNPQFELQLAQQALEPTRVPAGFHAHPHTLPFEPGVELLGFFAVRQTPFPQLTGLAVNKRNLLETRMIVTAYNQHVRLLSSEPFGGLRFQSLLGPGSRHCYGIITLIERERSLDTGHVVWMSTAGEILVSSRSSVDDFTRPGGGALRCVASLAPVE